MKVKVAYLIPDEGLLVRDPLTKNPLLKEGELKPLIGREGRYWRRRIKDGGVKIGEPPSQKSIASKRKKVED